MNTITLLLTICSILLYGVWFYFLATFPRDVLIAMQSQLLHANSKKRPGEWLYGNKEEFNSLWNWFRIRAQNILLKERIYIFKVILVWGGLSLVGLTILALPLTVKNTLGIYNFIPQDVFVLMFFYFWHLLHLKKYKTQGIQQKLIEETKDQLEELDHNEEDEFFNKFS